MRQTIGLLSGILVVIFALLTFMDTSDYALEKKLWRIKREFNIITHDPRGVPFQKYGKIINDYEDLIKRFPKSRQLSVVYLQLGRTYLLQRNFEEAIKNFQVILDKYPQSEAPASEALFYMAKTYEEKGDATTAVQVYGKILEKYPLTKIGLDIPLDIMDYYHRIHQPEQAKKARKEAIVFYQRMAEETNDSYLRLKILRRLSTAYGLAEDWENALQALEKAFFDWPQYNDMNANAVDGVIQSINSIAILHLKDHDRAMSIYQKFIQQNPEFEGTPKIKEVVKALEHFKNLGGLK